MFLPSQSSDYPPASLVIEDASILFSPITRAGAEFQLDGTVGYSNILIVSQYNEQTFVIVYVHIALHLS